MLRITAVKFERNENLLHGGKLRSANFLLGGVHAAACGLLMKGLRPLHTSHRKKTDEERK